MKNEAVVSLMHFQRVSPEIRTFFVVVLVCLFVFKLCVHTREDAHKNESILKTKRRILMKFAACQYR